MENYFKGHFLNLDLFVLFVSFKRTSVMEKHIKFKDRQRKAQETFIWHQRKETSGMSW